MMRWLGWRRFTYPCANCPHWELTLGPSLGPHLTLTVGRGIGRWEITAAVWTWRVW